VFVYISNVCVCVLVKDHQALWDVPGLCVCMYVYVCVVVEGQKALWDVRGVSVAVCCSVLRCVAVCCSVLQCVAVC